MLVDSDVMNWVKFHHSEFDGLFNNIH